MLQKVNLIMAHIPATIEIDMYKVFSTVIETKQSNSKSHA